MTCAPLLLSLLLVAAGCAGLQGGHRVVRGETTAMHAYELARDHAFAWDRDAALVGVYGTDVLRPGDAAILDLGGLGDGRTERWNVSFWGRERSIVRTYVVGPSAAPASTDQVALTLGILHWDDVGDASAWIVDSDDAIAQVLAAPGEEPVPSGLHLVSYGLDLRTMGWGVVLHGAESAAYAGVDGRDGRTRAVTSLDWIRDSSVSYNGDLTASESEFRAQLGPFHGAPISVNLRWNSSTWPADHVPTVALIRDRVEVPPRATDLSIGTNAISILTIRPSTSAWSQHVVVVSSDPAMVGGALGAFNLYVGTVAYRPLRPVH